MVTWFHCFVAFDEAEHCAGKVSQSKATQLMAAVLAEVL